MDQETAEKISAALKGKPKSPEHREAISRALRGKPRGCTPEQARAYTRNVQTGFLRHYVPDLRRFEDPMLAVQDAVLIYMTALEDPESLKEIL